MAAVLVRRMENGNNDDLSLCQVSGLTEESGPTKEVILGKLLSKQVSVNQGQGLRGVIHVEKVRWHMTWYQRSRRNVHNSLLQTERQNQCSNRDSSH